MFSSSPGESSPYCLRSRYSSRRRLLNNKHRPRLVPAERNPHGRSRLLQRRSFRHRTSPSLLVLNCESAALSTDSRSAVISTTGHLMNASGGGSTLLALDSSRVRVDPRLLSPSARVNDDAAYRVIVVGATSHAEADDIGDEIEELLARTTTRRSIRKRRRGAWRSGRNVRVKKRRSWSARLENAGFNASVQGTGI